MPWHCPACRTVIRHDVLENAPRPSTPYRCHVCRLDLRYDDAQGRLEIVPLETDHAVAPSRPRERVIPPPMTARRLAK